ncbi:MAG TPA: phage major capsid protein [Pseudonocardiaceae bacterium]|jgi:hypothetical protein|nr:phage major capsid protein [Pseudonocardiaceae bacterium]
MAQTIAGIASAVKDVWTSNRMLKQFYDENPVLAKLRDAPGTKVDNMGLQAQVPIHAQRSGGYTSTNAAGGVLNPAGQQGLAQATYTLVYHWFQVALETAVLNQTGGSSQSIVAGKVLEMEGAINDMSRQCTRQLVGNGDSIVAACATGGAATEVELLPGSSGGRGYGALQRGHLYAGLPVDIGTTADTDSLVTGSVITAVEEVEATPSITIGSSISTTAGTHFVYIANPNSATAPNTELNGFRNLAGTGTFGGINPATAGNEYWKAAHVDTTTTSFSLDMALNLQTKVFQKSGNYNAVAFTSAKQMAAFYSILQNQVRYNGEQGLGAGRVGGVTGLTWNGQAVNVLPDIYDSDWFMINMEDLVLVQGSIKKPTWATDLQGTGGDILWSPGTTGFLNGAVWPFQIGAQRRNRMAAATGLTA